MMHITKTAKAFVWVLACTLVAALPIGAPAAKASGKSINLTNYCNEKYSRGDTVLPYKARYDRKARLWLCEQATMMGPQMRGGDRRVIIPADACEFTFGTRLIHTHYGLDPAIEANMHCGVHDGVVPSMADMQPAYLSVCNKTNADGISFGYALKYRSSEDNSGWRSVGFWTVMKGQCETVSLPNNTDLRGYRGQALVFGANRDGFLPGSSLPICAKWGRRFLKENATDPNDCPTKGYTMMPTTWLTIKGGDNEFVFSEED